RGLKRLFERSGPRAVVREPRSKSKCLVISRVAEATISSSPRRGSPCISLRRKRQMWRLAIAFGCKRDCWLGRSASGQFSNNSIPCPTKPDRELDLCPQAHDTSAHCDIFKRYA